MKLPGRIWILIHRTQDRWWDLLAALSGYCNACPWSPVPGESSGYRHWRCGYQRGHELPHRYRNYTWGDDGRGTYDPLPNGHGWPEQPHDRTGTPTRRQARQSKAWLEQQWADMRAKRNTPAGAPDA